MARYAIAVCNVVVPRDRAEALDALAELDAKKWGEAEREASKAHHSHMSYGRLLNALAHRPEYDFGDAVPHLVAAAKAALTDADSAELRKGG